MLKQAGTEKGSWATYRMVVKASRLVAYETKGAALRPSGDDEMILRMNEVSEPMLPRKAACGAKNRTVPQTNTGGWGENPKALERTVAKELCKLAP